MHPSSPSPVVHGSERQSVGGDVGTQGSSTVPRPRFKVSEGVGCLVKSFPRPALTSGEGLKTVPRVPVGTRVEGRTDRRG